MASSSKASFSLPVHDCTAPSLDFDLQEKFILHTLEGKIRVSPGETGKLCSLTQPDKKDCHRTTKAIQDEKYFTELSKESDSLEHQVRKHLNSKNIDTWMQELCESEIQNTTLENKIAEWKHQIVEYKGQKLALKERSEQKKIVLEKAKRFQKQRAQHLEEAVKDVTSKIKEHEVKLHEILSASDVWKNQHDRIVEEKTMLEVQIEALEKQIRDLMEDMEKREEWRRNSEEEILGKLNSLNSENEKIYLENKKLKASLAMLEKSTMSVEYELLHMQEEAKLQENLVEHHKYEVQKNQIAVEELKSRCETVLNENKKITENKCLEADKDKHSATFMGNLCLEEEICYIQKKYEDLQRQLGQMEYQKEELAYQLTKEDESLQSSKLQLEEKIAEYNALTRQLESTLEEGKKMVAEEWEKISYQEQAFQTKLLLLEDEVRKRQEEKKHLLFLFRHNEKHYEVHLKELENSLQKSVIKNQMIQNYVQFLKDAYVIMFS
ncbi:protein BCAP isoform X8 [Taeniopygia guttata]|uniref:protein BCAP isoform X8 n=1 Tax=Taeniopygia guttata TaxID=59729 RepID=UPI003BB92C72